MAFMVQSLAGIPNDKLSDFIADSQMNPRYVAHLAVPEGGGTTFVVLVVHPPSATLVDPEATSAPARKKKSGGKKK
jgi:hypothetical protein